VKTSEIRGLGPDEAGRKLSDLRQELFNLRFQHFQQPGVSQLENPRRMNQIRRDIARVKTILRERELAAD
jgi:large subunit ribosomal protein L29